MTERWIARLLVAGCVLCLVALGLMVWSVLAPAVVSVMLAMSVGQGIGTLSFLCYLGAVLLDLRRKRVLGGDREPSPSDGDARGEDPR